MPAKRRTVKLKAPATPLGSKQRALLEEQETLRKKMAKLERLIEDAPKRAEAEEKIRREELFARSEPASRRGRPSALGDKRHNTVFAPALAGVRPRRRRPLRSEQRQARLLFFALLFGLAVVLLWLWSVWGK